MLRKEITYKNLDGEQVTETHYFHLTKAELIKAEVSEEGGLRDKMMNVVKSGNARLILETFEDIVRRSFGRRTQGGGFVKRESDWEEFVSSEAYSTLFMELVTDASFAAEFVKGIMPDDLPESAPDEQLADLRKQLTGSTEDVEVSSVPEEVDNRPAWVREDRDPTQRELQRMTPEELREAMERKIGQMSEPRSGG